MNSVFLFDYNRRKMTFYEKTGGSDVYPQSWKSTLGVHVTFND